MSTPTKAAEIREALESIVRKVRDELMLRTENAWGLERWSCCHKDMEGEHSPACPAVLTLNNANRAISLLADLDGGGGVVKYGTTPGLQHNCSGCDFLSTPSESKHFHYCPGCGSGIEPSPTATDAPPDPDAHITDQEQYLKTKQERAKDVDFEDNRTPDETIEQQARREAEARYPYAMPGVMDDWERHSCINGYIAALVAERAKDVDFDDSRKPVDVAEVIKAGDALHDAGEHEYSTVVVGDNVAHSRLYNALIQWNNATRPFRP